LAARGGATTLTGNGNNSQNNSFSKKEHPVDDRSIIDPDLLELQQILFEGTSLSFSRPKLNDLSVEELEELLARKKAELAQKQPLPVLTAPAARPLEPKTGFAGPGSRALAVRFQPESPLYQAEPSVGESGFNNGFIEDVPTARFAPASLIAAAPEKVGVAAKTGPLQRVRNLLGYTLETLVVIAAIALSGNWLLQQAGVNLYFFGPAQVADFSVAASRPEGLYLSANAGGVISLPPTAVPATATPVQPTPTALPDLSPVVILPSPTPDQPPTPALAVAVAPTPTPAIVPPVRQSTAQGAATPAPPPGPARRLVIPKIGLDTPVKEVTVNLGNWQVADFVAGHHHGTAMPGQPGNMVLAGHRDIRGSIFLRLNELQKGDEFRVITDSASYRYVVTEVKEVAPNEISVLTPTIDATATLITCTPVGLATRRLILKAVLVQ
jgi:LPXTG-site transpeptidase (sortase) family protein